LSTPWDNITLYGNSKFYLIYLQELENHFHKLHTNLIIQKNSKYDPQDGCQMLGGEFTAPNHYPPLRGKTKGQG